MTLQICMVNETGKDRIRQFVLEHHKRPDEASSEQAMARWVMEAEVCADTGEEVRIEIAAQDSVSGQACVLPLDEDCLDIVRVEEIS